MIIFVIVIFTSTTLAAPVQVTEALTADRELCPVLLSLLQTAPSYLPLLSVMEENTITFPPGGTVTAEELPFPTSILTYMPGATLPAFTVLPPAQGSIISAPGMGKRLNMLPEFAIIIIIVAGTIFLVSLCTFVWMLYRRKVRYRGQRIPEQTPRHGNDRGNADANLGGIPGPPPEFPIQITTDRTTPITHNYPQEGRQESLQNAFARNLLLHYIGRRGTIDNQARSGLAGSTESSFSARPADIPRPRPIQTSRRYDSVISSILNRYISSPRETSRSMRDHTDDIELSDFGHRREYSTSLEDDGASGDSRQGLIPRLGRERGFMTATSETASTRVSTDSEAIPHRPDRRDSVESIENSHDPNYILQPRVYQPEVPMRQLRGRYERQGLPDLEHRNDGNLFSEHYPNPSARQLRRNEGQDDVAVENTQCELHSVHQDNGRTARDEPHSRRVRGVRFADMEAELRPQPLTLRKPSSQQLPILRSERNSETPYSQNRPVGQYWDQSSSSRNPEGTPTTVQTHYPGSIHAQPPSSVKKVSSDDQARYIARQASRDYFVKELQRLRDAATQRRARIEAQNAAATTHPDDSHQEVDLDLPIQNFEEDEESLVDPALAIPRTTAQSRTSDNNNELGDDNNNQDNDNSEVTINPRRGRHGDSNLFVDDRIPNRFQSAVSRDIESMIQEGASILSPSIYSRTETIATRDEGNDGPRRGVLTLEDFRRCVRAAREEQGGVGDEVEDDEE